VTVGPGSPVCDPILGLTKGCECKGKMVVEKVIVKPLVSQFRAGRAHVVVRRLMILLSTVVCDCHTLTQDLDKDANAVRNAANVAAFASGDRMRYHEAAPVVL
jgi:hypothetical protein